MSLSLMAMNEMTPGKHNDRQQAVFDQSIHFVLDLAGEAE